MYWLLIALAGLLCAICTGIAYAVGRAVGMRDAKRRMPAGPRRYDVHVSPTVTQHLHFIGNLDERRFKLLCNWVTDGKSFRLQALTNAHILTRTQFEGVRKELLDRGLAYQNTNKTIEIAPPGHAFFRWGAGRRKQANSK